MRITKSLILEDRGTPKTFEITELPAYDMEEFCMRAGALLIGTGVLGAVDVDSVQSSADVLPLLASIIKNSGGFAALGNVNQTEFKALREQLLQSVRIVTPGGAKLPLTKATIDGNIDDYKTLLKLEFEALKLNLNFSLSGDNKISDTSANKATPQRKPKISVQS